MASWERLQTLGGEDSRTKLQEIYNKFNFPIEVRGLFAEWIEEQEWQRFDESEQDHLENAKELYEALIKKVEQKAQQTAADLITQMRYVSYGSQLKNAYEKDTWQLVVTLKGILVQEQQLIELVNGPTPSVATPGMDMDDTPASPAIPDIGEFIEQLKLLAQKTDANIKTYKQQQEEFVIHYQEICKVDAEISQAQQNSNLNQQQKDQQLQILNKRKSDVENMLRQKAEKILEDRDSIFNQLDQLSLKADQVSQKVYEELFIWRITQQKSLSGGRKPEPLDDLQNWFESLTDVQWAMYQLTTQYKLLFDALPIIKRGDEKEGVERLLQKSVSNLTSLIQRSFIVDKQPPQVLKTQTKFQASVRLLVGSKLNLQMHCPEVTTTIISEKQAKELCNGKTIDDTGNCGEILNCRSVMEYNQNLRMLHADFKNLSLKKIKRQDRKGQESVLEAKSALVFSAAITIGGEKLPVLCMSVPVVVVVHGNQGPNSEATVIWDNMFSKPDREPFDVPDDVSWRDMARALHCRWMLTSEKELTEEHVEYLGAKLFQGNDIKEFDNKTVLWASFNKEPLKGRNFTFWEWFHGAMEIVKRHLKDHWNDGYLEFMSRIKAQEILMTRPPGTFLIRFSDGEIGGISIAWVVLKQNGEKEIWNLQPWTAKDFSIRSLADRIFDLQHLTNIYPNTRKDHAFGKFRSQEYMATQPDPNGYVLSGIMAKINFGSSGGMPHTPGGGAIMDPLPSPPHVSGDLLGYSPRRNSAEFANSYLGNVIAKGQVPKEEKGVEASYVQQSLMTDFDPQWADAEVDSLLAIESMDSNPEIKLEEFVQMLMGTNGGMAATK